MRKGQSFKSQFSIFLVTYALLGTRARRQTSAFVFSLYVNRVHHTLLPGVKTQAHADTNTHTSQSHFDVYSQANACVQSLTSCFLPME